MNNTLSTPFLVLSHDMLKMMSFTYVGNVLIYSKTVGLYSANFKIIEIHLYSKTAGSKLAMKNNDKGQNKNKNKNTPFKPVVLWCPGLLCVLYFLFS